MSAPAHRMIVHKFDPDLPAPGGIDTCIRGILRYRPAAEALSIVGVSPRPEQLGRWHQARLGATNVRFMPVALIDPGDQIRRLPHSLRIALGLLRRRRRIATPTVIQTHRADLALLCMVLWPKASHTYFIHTQESGLLGAESDSFWRRLAVLHRKLEQFVVRHADAVRVFNADYAEKVATWNSQARFSPTWWDPALVQCGLDKARPPDKERNLIWVGRFETPKNPALAVKTLAYLRSAAPERDWRLTMVGTGNLFEATSQLASQLGLGDSVRFTGRLRPAQVMEQLASSRVLLMTSVEGYEGYPRVLVEALALGCSAVVTAGADTGALVREGVNGFRARAFESELGNRVIDAISLRSTDSIASVSHLRASEVISSLYADEALVA